MLIITACRFRLPVISGFVICGGVLLAGVAPHIAAVAAELAEPHRRRGALQCDARRGARKTARTAGHGGRCDDAAKLFRELVEAPSFPEFLTLPAYDLITADVA
jgi:hypothetical protein